MLGIEARVMQAARSRVAAAPSTIACWCKIKCGSAGMPLLSLPPTGALRGPRLNYWFSLGARARHRPIDCHRWNARDDKWIRLDRSENGSYKQNSAPNLSDRPSKARLNGSFSWLSGLDPPFFFFCWKGWEITDAASYSHDAQENGCSQTEGSSRPQEADRVMHVMPVIHLCFVRLGPSIHLRHHVNAAVRS